MKCIDTEEPAADNWIHRMMFIGASIFRIYRFESCRKDQFYPAGYTIRQNLIDYDGENVHIKRIDLFLKTGL